MPPPQRMGFTAHVAGAFADLLFVIGFVLLASATFIVLDNYVLPPALRQSWFVTDLMPAGLVALYIFAEARFATSPGKWLVTLTVRAADGRPASHRRLLIRCAIKYFPLLILAADFVARSVSAWLHNNYPPSIWEIPPTVRAVATFALYFILVGSLLCLLPARQTLHDLIAGTALFLDSELPRHDDDRPVARGFEIQPAPRASDAPPARHV